jgi:hypothetical protein
MPDRVIITIMGVVRAHRSEHWVCTVRYDDGGQGSRTLPGATDRDSALAARDALAASLGVPVRARDRPNSVLRSPGRPSTHQGTRRVCPACGSLYRPTTTPDGQRVDRLCLACWRGDAPTRGPSTNYLRASEVDAAVERLEREGFLPRAGYTSDGVRFEREEAA